MRVSLENDEGTQGVVYEMESGPVHIQFDLNDDNFFDVHIIPLNVNGEVYITVGTERMSLKQLCPNNDRIVLKTFKSYENVKRTKVP